MQTIELMRKIGAKATRRGKTYMLPECSLITFDNPPEKGMKFFCISKQGTFTGLYEFTKEGEVFMPHTLLPYTVEEIMPWLRSAFTYWVRLPDGYNMHPYVEVYCDDEEQAAINCKEEDSE